MHEPTDEPMRRLLIESLVCNEGAAAHKRSSTTTGRRWPRATAAARRAPSWNGLHGSPLMRARCALPARLDGVPPLIGRDEELAALSTLADPHCRP